MFSDIYFCVYGSVTYLENIQEKAVMSGKNGLYVSCCQRMEYIFIYKRKYENDYYKIKPAIY